ncbi:MAG: ABC-type transporter, integral rane subunit [Actinomycetia bacterium]|nr:ABC-type transporter, integral rane subunit [Actinomycetes bacterium]
MNPGLHVGSLLATGSGIADLFAHPFVRNALLAGTAIAAASGLVGYFVVLRSQVFSGDALSHVAFAGALGALAFGIDARVGLFAATILVGLGLGVLGRGGRADDVVIGTVFTWILGLGVLFLSIYTTSSSTGNGAANVNVLFGSIFGLSSGEATLAAVIGGVLCVAVLAIARPLLFASIDEAVATARGVPVRVLGIVFLGLVGVCAGEATQAVGALLLVGLVAAPAGAAQRLTSRPWVGLGLAAGLAVLALWVGVLVSYVDGDIPPSFAIMAAATAMYLLAYGAGRVRAARGSREATVPVSRPVPADAA